jgi:rhodanese-related sulfurtransferase
MDYEIDPKSVSQLSESGTQFTLLDVREPWEFETARIEGAKLIPMAGGIDAWSRSVDSKVPVY